MLDCRIAEPGKHRVIIRHRAEPRDGKADACRLERIAVFESVRGGIAFFQHRLAGAFCKPAGIELDQVNLFPVPEHPQNGIVRRLQIERELRLDHRAVFGQGIEFIVIQLEKDREAAVLRQLSVVAFIILRVDPGSWSIRLYVVQSSPSGNRIIISGYASI